MVIAPHQFMPSFLFPTIRFDLIDAEFCFYTHFYPQNYTTSVFFIVETGIDKSCMHSSVHKTVLVACFPLWKQ
jgi:hypothetical protein